MNVLRERDLDAIERYQRKYLLNRKKSKRSARLQLLKLEKHLLMQVLQKRHSVDY